MQNIANLNFRQFVGAIAFGIPANGSTQLERLKQVREQLLASLKDAPSEFKMQAAEGEKLAGEWMQKFAAAHQKEMTNITITRYGWRTEGVGNLMMAEFALRNENEFDVKDIEITCIRRADSGTVIDENTRTVYEIVKESSVKTVSNLNMGSIHSDSAQPSCAIVNFAHDWPTR